MVGVAGGSASGKSSVVRALVRRLEPEPVTVLAHDAYYRDLSHLDPEARSGVNVDHPDSLETDLLVRHLAALRLGRAVEAPVYDFATHTRSDRTRPLAPASIVVVEGLFVLAEPPLREMVDVGAFVDVPEDERLARRVARDVAERGRTAESVRADHDRRVQPMHRAFVEPSRAHADIVIEGGAENGDAVRALADRIRDRL